MASECEVDVLIISADTSETRQFSINGYKRLILFSKHLGSNNNHAGGLEVREVPLGSEGHGFESKNCR